MNPSPRRLLRGDRIHDPRPLIQNNDLTEVACHYIWEWKDVLKILQQQPDHSSLKFVSFFCDRNLGTRPYLLIANVLRVNKSILELTLKGHHIRNDGFVAIVEALSNSNNTTLKRLTLLDSAHCSDIRIDYDSCVAIGHMLTTNNTLTDLDLWGCSINSHHWPLNSNWNGAKVIGDSLKKNTTLTGLDLQRNNVGDEGAIAIIEGMKENNPSSLRSLNLCRNNIGIIGTRSIATMLRTSESLTGLNLGQNEAIGKEGVIAIVEALKCNKTLSTLKLYDIPFGDECAIKIAAFLKRNFTLKELDINNCNIGDDGAVAISVVLKFSSSLTLLDISKNQISRSVINEFAAMLKVNTGLKELLLGFHIEPIMDGVMDDVIAGRILQTLEDYNDTVCIDLSQGYCSPLALKIRAIGEDNRKGIRVAPKKADLSRRTIFNSLQYVWKHKSV